jgi:para-aminobenzoate synthetase component 1
MLLKLAFEDLPLERGEFPQELFSRLQGDYSSLLQSGKGGRYSYIGYDPFLVVWSSNGVTQSVRRKNFFDLKKSIVGQIFDGEPLDVLRKLFKKFEFKGEAPVPFFGGAIGYFSYDYGCCFLDVKQKVYDDTGIPDYLFCFYDKIIAIDHEVGKKYIFAIAETDISAERKIGEIKKDLMKPLPLIRKGRIGKIKSNVTKEQYANKITEIRSLLERGETYQANFSQRFSGICTLPPYEVYKKLARRNPSPFACYLDYPQFKVVSCSPELLLRKRGRDIESWPIKGTVKRGKNSAEDEKLEKKLLSSKKDKAELSMITDLVRNDLGQVSQIGSVKVAGFREIEKCSHVIHTFSRIVSKLDNKKDLFDCIRAAFPGGSITGCPKKRTVEIIDKLEDYKRGVYTGSAGFISFAGDCDLNILIRTMLFKDDMVYFHSGGGIVYDSVAENEYDETIQKAKALLFSIKK